MLHDAIMGAFRSTGRAIEPWLRDNGIPRATARQAAFGQSKGPAGQELLARMIEAAGPDLVRSLYVARLYRHLEEVRRAQSQLEAEHARRPRERRAS